jgi:hypothetical protein
MRENFVWGRDVTFLGMKMLLNVFASAERHLLISAMCLTSAIQRELTSKPMPSSDAGDLLIS